MHVVSNIRNLDKFMKCFPWASKDSLSGSELFQYSSLNDQRAHHYNLVIVKVVQNGATVTETRDGQERELTLGEWLVAPLIGRESTLGHSSVLPVEGIAVGSIIDYVSTGGGIGVSLDNPPNKTDPTKGEVLGILRYEDGKPATALDFALSLRTSEKLLPVIAVVGSKSDAGKTSACLDIIKNLHDKGKIIGVTKLSGTAQRKETLELAIHANEWLDTADAGMPTTYPPSQENDDRTATTVKLAIQAAERNLQDLSFNNDIIVAEFGGDLLSASVPEILADPERLHIVALVLVAESATAAIGMETKLYRISERYRSVPKYVVGPTANLLANRNRVKRETDCAGCFDLWTKRCDSVPQHQKDSSIADTEEFVERLLKDCGY